MFRSRGSGLRLWSALLLCLVEFASSEGEEQVAADIGVGVVQGFVGSHLSVEDVDCVSRYTSSISETFVLAVRRLVAIGQTLREQQLYDQAQESRRLEAATTDEIVLDISVTTGTEQPVTVEATEGGIHATTSPDDVTIRMAVDIPRLLEDLSEIFTMQRQLTQACWDQPLQSFWDSFQLKLQDASYLGNQLLVNGADILTDITDAAHQFRNKNYTESGVFLGAAIRRIVLESSSQSVKAPPAWSQDDVTGFLEGFFQGLFEGTRVEVINGETNFEWKIDLDSCTSSQTDYFGRLVESFGSLVNETNMTALDSHRSWQTALTGSVLQLPLLLSACGINRDILESLLGAIVAANSTSGYFDDDWTPSWDVFLEETKKSFQAFKDEDWIALGSHIGKALHECMEGIAAEMAASLYSIEQVDDSPIISFVSPSAWLALAGLALPLLIIAGIFRRMQKARREGSDLINGDIESEIE